MPKIKYRAPQESKRTRKNKLRELSQLRLSDLKRRFGNECKSCGSTEEITVDHIVPISKGGGINIENLQLLCKKCNGEKADKF